MFFPDSLQKRILLPMNLHNLGIGWDFVLSFPKLFRYYWGNVRKILQNLCKMKEKC